MAAIELGPLVLSTPRFAAILGAVAFLVAAQIRGRRDDSLTDWAWTGLILFIVGARLGFVIENLGVYLQEPLTILFVWQGGFSPWWGFAVAAVYTVLWPAGRRAVISQQLSVAAVGGAVWGGSLLLLTPAATADVSLPDTRIFTMANQETQLAQIAGGQPIVVNLWAPWCPPCQRETPMMLDVAGSEDSVTFALVDQGSAVSEVVEFLEERGLQLEDVYLDPRTAVADELRSIGLPTTLFFGSQGELQHTHVGEISRAELLRHVRSLSQPQPR